MLHSLAILASILASMVALGIAAIEYFNVGSTQKSLQWFAIGLLFLILAR